MINIYVSFHALTSQKERT